MALPALTRRAVLTAASAGALAFACSERIPRGRRVASLWFTYGGKNRQVLEELVLRFNRSQNEHWISAVFQGDYYEGLAKLRTAIAAKAAPTLSHVVGEVVPYLARAAVLEPLGSYPGADSLGIVDELGQAKSWRGGAARPLVALPFNRSTPVAYVNGDIFGRAGIKPPTTWTELAATARALSHSTGGARRWGFGCPVDWWFWVALAGQAGGQVVEPDGTISLAGEAGVEAVRFWQRLVQVDRSMKPPPGRDYNAWEQTNQDFLAGRTAMIWTSTAFLKYLEANARFPLIAAPLPAQRRHAVPTGGTFWIVLASAPRAEKETAWAFLRFMHETDNAIHWATQTGYLPVTHSAIATLRARGYYAEHPNDAVALDQLSVVQPWPWSAELFRVQREAVQPRLEDAVLSNANAATVMAEARRLAQAEGG